MKHPVALTIAGSDPSGGAGIQADLKTFTQHRVYGASAITLLTVQNTMRVSRVVVSAPDVVGAQIDAVVEDLPVQAAKTGALGDAGVIEAVVARARGFSFPLVVDPVMISKHGAPLLDADASTKFGQLFRCATLITPNGPELAAITGRSCETIELARVAAKQLRDDSGAAVLLKGGHFEGDATDWLITASDEHRLPAERIDTKHTHGTGCTYSAAIAARLAKGEELLGAVRGAKEWLHRAIENAPGLGAGQGPVEHLTPL